MSFQNGSFCKLKVWHTKKAYKLSCQMPSVWQDFSTESWRSCCKSPSARRWMDQTFRINAWKITNMTYIHLTYIAKQTQQPPTHGAEVRPSRRYACAQSWLNRLLRKAELMIGQVLPAPVVWCQDEKKQNLLQHACTVCDLPLMVLCLFYIYPHTLTLYTAFSCLSHFLSPKLVGLTISVGYLQI